MQFGLFKQIFRSIKLEHLENSLQGEDFRKTPLSCLCVYRKPQAHERHGGRQTKIFLV